MQVTVGTNSGVIAEKMECGDIVISAEGVSKVDNIDRSVKVEHALFAFAMRAGHTAEQIDKAMDELRVVCAGSNAHSLARKLVELENEGYVQVLDEKPSDVFKELQASFGVENIKEKAFREALRREG